MRSHVCRTGGHQHDLRRLQDGNPRKELHRKIQNEISLQAAIDQLLEEHTLDLIVDGLANGDFCANIGSLTMTRI